MLDWMRKMRPRRLPREAEYMAMLPKETQGRRGLERPEEGGEENNEFNF